MFDSNLTIPGSKWPLSFDIIFVGLIRCTGLDLKCFGTVQLPSFDAENSFSYWKCTMCENVQCAINYYEAFDAVSTYQKSYYIPP